VSRPVPGSPPGRRSRRWPPHSLLRALLLGLAAGVVIAIGLTDVVLLSAVLLLGSRDLALPVTVALLPFWFLVASWWDWSFTAGFGDRAFNDIVPILAIPLAFVFARLSRPRTRMLVGGVCLVLVAVTCVQMVNHWLGPLPGSGIGPSGFFRILVFRS